jgi:callose synthase
MAADSGGKDRDLNKRMGSDPYFSYAIRECYASFKNIINTLVIGRREIMYVYLTINLVTSNRRL